MKKRVLLLTLLVEIGVGGAVVAADNMMGNAEYTAAVASSNVQDVAAVLHRRDLSPTQKRGAIKRLGSLKSKEAVPLLVDVFHEERSSEKTLVSPSTAKQVILSLEDIGGEESLAAIAGILGNILDQGPLSDYRPWADRTYMAVAWAAIEALGRDGSPSSIRLLTDIYRNPKVENSLREFACQLCLRAEMTKHGFETTSASAEWLLGLLPAADEWPESDWVEGETGVKTLAGVRSSSVLALLRSLGSAALPAFDEAVQNAPEDLSSVDPRTRELVFVMRHIMRDDARRKAEEEEEQAHLPPEKKKSDQKRDWRQTDR